MLAGLELELAERERRLREIRDARLLVHRLPVGLNGEGEVARLLGERAEHGVSGLAPFGGVGLRDERIGARLRAVSAEELSDSVDLGRCHALARALRDEFGVVRLRFVDASLGKRDVRDEEPRLALLVEGEPERERLLQEARALRGVSELDRRDAAPVEGLGPAPGVLPGGERLGEREVARRPLLGARVGHRLAVARLRGLVGVGELLRRLDVLRLGLGGFSARLVGPREPEGVAGQAGERIGALCVLDHAGGVAAGRGGVEAHARERKLRVGAVLALREAFEVVLEEPLRGLVVAGSVRARPAQVREVVRRAVAAQRGRVGELSVEIVAPRRHGPHARGVLALGVALHVAREDACGLAVLLLVVALHGGEVERLL